MAAFEVAALEQPELSMCQMKCHVFLHPRLPSIRLQMCVHCCEGRTSVCCSISFASWVILRLSLRLCFCLRQRFYKLWCACQRWKRRLSICGMASAEPDSVVAACTSWFGLSAHWSRFAISALGVWCRILRNLLHFAIMALGKCILQCSSMQLKLRI